eukprot:11199009-Lingulodinium_polyedra.AAC.1
MLDQLNWATSMAHGRKGQPRATRGYSQNRNLRWLRWRRPCGRRSMGQRAFVLRAKLLVVGIS